MCQFIRRQVNFIPLVGNIIHRPTTYYVYRCHTRISNDDSYGYGCNEQRKKNYPKAFQYDYVQGVSMKIYDTQLCIRYIICMFYAIPISPALLEATEKFSSFDNKSTSCIDILLRSNDGFFFFVYCHMPCKFHGVEWVETKQPINSTSNTKHMSIIIIIHNECFCISCSASMRPFEL